MERLDELQQVVTEEKPDPSTREHGKNVPALTGTVASLVLHPITGKLAEAGGDLLVADFQRRSGGNP